MEVHVDTAAVLDHYEVSHDGSQVRLAERQWKPTKVKGVMNPLLVKLEPFGWRRKLNP